MGYRVGFIDRDTNYALSLMEYVNSRRKLGVVMSAFSDRERLAEYVVANTLDILLVGDDIDPYGYGIPYIRICGSVKEATENGFIYKYQSADRVMSQIMQSLKLTKGVCEDRRLMYGIYSPIGRCGKTRLALALTREVSSLYINLEEFPGLECTQEDRRIADTFLYYWASNNSELKGLLKNINCGEGAGRRIMGFGNPSEVGRIKAEDMAWLRKCISETELERVVLDMGTLPREGMELLRELDFIYIPVLDDAASAAKLVCFRDRYRELLNELSQGVNYINVPDCPFDSYEMKKFVEEVL